jgi:hypothetical protein
MRLVMGDDCCTAERVPIACSLDAGALRDREREVRALARRALVHREQTASGAVLVFRETSGEIEAAVRELVRREKECCPFFDFVVDAREGTIRLAIDAPVEARAFVDALLDAAEPER